MPPAPPRTLFFGGATMTPLPIEVTSTGKRLGSGTLQPKKSEAKVRLDTAGLTGPRPIELHLKATAAASIATFELR